MGPLARPWGLVLLMMLATGTACGASGFALTNATVDASHTCAVGSKNSPYDLHASVEADNSTSSSVDVRAASAVLIVAAVHGLWQEPVGSKYDAGEVPFSPSAFASNSKTTLNLTIPSACTNGAHPGVTDFYADYSVQLTVVTSAGTFHLTSQNTHRILAP